MPRKKLKLYVWEGVLTDYTDGVMFALAHNVEEAREVICPGWNEAEKLIRTVPGIDPLRPLGKRGGKSKHGYYVGDEHKDLRADPDIYDAPVGFAVGGGG